MRGSGERAQAGGDGIVAARLDLHVIGRVGVDQMNRRAIEQPVHVFRLARVAAQQTVITQDPQVAGLRDRFVRRLGNLVGIAQAFLQVGVQQLGQLLGSKPNRPRSKSSSCRSSNSIGSNSKSHSASWAV